MWNGLTGLESSIRKLKVKMKFFFPVSEQVIWTKRNWNAFSSHLGYDTDVRMATQVLLLCIVETYGLWIITLSDINLKGVFSFFTFWVTVSLLWKAAKPRVRNSPACVAGCSWWTFIECEGKKSGIEFLLKPLMSRVRPGLKGGRGRHLDLGPSADHIVSDCFSDLQVIIFYKDCILKSCYMSSILVTRSIEHTFSSVGREDMEVKVNL